MSLLNAVIEGTQTKIAQHGELDEDSIYAVDDMPIGGMTGEDMHLAISPSRYGVFYKAGDVYVCTQNYTENGVVVYREKHTYKIEVQNNAPVWVDLTILPTKGTVTIQPSAFASAQSYANIAVTGLTVNDHIWLRPNSMTDEAEVVSNGIFVFPDVELSGGVATILVYAETIPSENIVLSYTIIKGA